MLWWRRKWCVWDDSLKAPFVLGWCLSLHISPAVLPAKFCRHLTPASLTHCSLTVHRVPWLLESLSLVQWCLTAQDWLHSLFRTPTVCLFWRSSNGSSSNSSSSSSSSSSSRRQWQPSSSRRPSRQPRGPRARRHSSSTHRLLQLHPCRAPLPCIPPPWPPGPPSPLPRQPQRALGSCRSCSEFSLHVLSLPWRDPPLQLRCCSLFSDGLTYLCGINGDHAPKLALSYLRREGKLSYWVSAPSKGLSEHLQKFGSFACMLGPVKSSLDCIIVVDISL